MKVIKPDGSSFEVEADLLAVVQGFEHPRCQEEGNVTEIDFTGVTPDNIDQVGPKWTIDFYDELPAESGFTSDEVAVRPMMDYLLLVQRIFGGVF